jgi:hypothetical protein
MLNMKSLSILWGSLSIGSTGGGLDAGRAKEINTANESLSPIQGSLVTFSFQGVPLRSTPGYFLVATPRLKK